VDFSPSGDRLVKALTTDQGDRDGIYVMPLRGGAPRLVERSETFDLAPKWSPDGETIAFSRIFERGPGARRTFEFGLLAVAAGGGRPGSRTSAPWTSRCLGSRCRAEPTALAAGVRAVGGPMGRRSRFRRGVAVGVVAMAAGASPAMASFPGENGSWLS
jgi:hypothetical protein